MYKILRTWICTTGESVGQRKAQLVNKYDNDKDARDCFNRTTIDRTHPAEQISLLFNGDFVCGKV